MSFILDALKKSEQERELGRVPTIKTVHYADTTLGSRKSVWPRVAAAIILINVIIAGVIYWRIQPQKNQTPVVDLTLSPNTNTSINVNPTPMQERVASEDTLPVDKEQSFEIQEVEDNQTDDSDVSIEDSPIDESDELASINDAASDPMLEEQSVPNTTNIPGLQNEDLPPSSSSDQFTGGANNDLGEDAPLLSKLDPLFQQSLPPLAINVHVYAENKGERFVFINMVKYREGAKVASGLTLKEITPDGVVLNFRNQPFRLLRP